MDLLSILPSIIAGVPVRRGEWKHDDRFVQLLTVPVGGVPPVTGEPVMVNYSKGQVANYVISNEDFNATDWETL